MEGEVDLEVRQRLAKERMDEEGQYSNVCKAAYLSGSFSRYRCVSASASSSLMSRSTTSAFFSSIAMIRAVVLVEDLMFASCQYGGAAAGWLRERFSGSRGVTWQGAVRDKAS